MMTDEENAENKVEVAPTNITAEEAVPEHSSLAYAGMFISAVILLIALTSDESNLERHKYYEYGISVASIAMILSFVGWLIVYANKSGTEQALLYTNYFLFVWNFIGAGFLTFDGPFDKTGNGYFGAWGIVVFATMALGVNMATVRSAASSTIGPSMALIACAIIVMVAISSEGVDKDDSHFAEMLYGLLLSIATILIVGAMIKGGESAEAAQLYVMAAMAIMWSVAAGLLTFRGPFLVTGNGYFGSWGAALTSVFATNAARQQSSS